MAFFDSEDKTIQVAGFEYETDDDELGDDLWLKVDESGIKKLTLGEYRTEAEGEVVECSSIANDGHVKVNDHSKDAEPGEDLFHLIEQDEVRDEIAEYVGDGRTVIIAARINKKILAEEV